MKTRPTRIIPSFVTTNQLVVNKTKRRKNYDPTRTLSMRQAFVRQIRVRFKVLKGRLYKLVVVDDAFGLKEKKPFALNAFCPTGTGGGVDPSCLQGGGHEGKSPAESIHGMPRRTLLKVKAVTAKLKQKLVDRYGVKTATAIVVAAQATAWGSAAAAPFVGLPGAWIPSMVAALPYVGLAELKHQLTKGHATTNEEITEQEIQQAAKELIEELRRELAGEMSATANTDFSFASSPEQLKKFQEWLRQQYASLLVGKSDEELWQIYAEQGFKRGAGRAFDDVNRGYYASKMDDEGLPDFMAGGRDQFLRSAFGRPETVEKVQLLASRSFTDLVGVTEFMATGMSRVLVDGLTQGMNPRAIADQMDDVLDIGLHRADVIARTEIIRAHAEGQLDAFERLGVTEIGVEVEWSTAGDERVCPECDDMEGKTFSVDDAHGMIPLHPQCRCAFTPVIPESLTK